MRITKAKLLGAVAIGLTWVSGYPIEAVTPSDTERNTARDWAAVQFEGDPPGGGAFFSFVYDGKKSSELLPLWKLDRTKKENPDGSVAHTLHYTDPTTGLVIQCEGLTYRDFPTIEWVLTFKNNSAVDTPILEDIRAMDVGFLLPREKSARVHYANGSECRVDDFAPLVTSLGPNEQDPQGAWLGENNPLRLESKGGRSSCGRLPFFNLDMNNRGAMIALGWTGDWNANFYRTDSEVRMNGGMKKTHFKLLPGEEVRSPRAMLLFWEGERIRGHNLLRQFILSHHSPQIENKVAEPPFALATWGGNFVDKHIAHGKWIKDHQIPLDYLWVDAGWFGNDEAKEGATVFNSQWAAYVGDWHANPGYFPQGLGPLGKSLEGMDLGFLLWLEPERVYKDTTWTREHPEFLLGPIGDNSLFDLGNPEARKMLADHLCSLIQESGMDCYRQDFNMDPRPFWDANDTPDRIGISEIRHITGLYALWDELLARNPGLLIDNCSSGGRRIDLETISRSIPLWRSDVQCWPNFGATAMQGQTYGLGLWTPLSIGCCDRQEDYVFRSALGPGMVLIMYHFEQDTAKHFSLDWLQTMTSQLEKARPLFLGDFYPLVSFSLAEDAWSVWQYDRPDLGEGLVVALRRPESPFTTMTAALQGLDPEGLYEIRNLDSQATVKKTGKELSLAGQVIQIDQKSGSQLLVYRKVR